MATDPQIQQVVAEQKRLQKPFRLSERVTKRHTLLVNDPKRKEFEDRAVEVIRWVRHDCIRWLNEHGDASEKPGQYCHTSKPFTDALAAADGFVGNAFGEEDWVAVEMAEEALNEVDVVQAWTQALSKWLMSHYRYGTWWLIQPAVTLDTMTFGNSLTYTGRQGRDTYHRKCNILNAYIKRLNSMFIGQIHYLEPYMAGEAYEKWGDKLSEATCRAAFEEPTKRVTIIRCVYGVEDTILEGLPVDVDREHTHYEVLIEQDSPKNTSAYDSKDPLCGILEHHGYVQNPFSDWPYWLPDSEDAYGWSAYGCALISIKRLHAMFKGLTNATQRATEPPMKTTLRNKNKIDLRPGRTTAMENPTDLLEEVYKHAIQYPLTLDWIERMEAELEEVLHLPLFRAMTLRQKEMTVPEVLEVIAEKSRQLAPRIGTRQYLYDNPIHERTLSLARIAGEGPINRQPPGMREFVEANNLSPDLRMRYKGPLAEANEMVQLSRRVSSTVTLLQGLATIGEQAATDVQDSLKAGTLAEHILDKSDLPQDVITTEEEKKQAKAQRAAAAALQMAQLAAQTGETASRMGKADAETTKIAGETQ